MFLKRAHRNRCGCRSLSTWMQIPRWRSVWNRGADGSFPRRGASN